MGVSTGADGDFHVIANGGADFVKRMADFQIAAANYKQSLDDLNLGKSAIAANDEAQRVLGDAKERRDAQMAALAKEVETAKNDIASKREAAQLHLDQCVAKHNEAESKLAFAQSFLGEHSTIRSRAEADAKKVVQAAQNQADKLISDANDVAKKLKADVEAQLEKTKGAEAKAAKLAAKYETALAKIKSAVIPD